MNRLRNHKRGIIFALLVIAFAGLGLAAAHEGVRVYRVTTGSMQPTLPVGSIIITYPKTQLEERDIITFREPGTAKLITHTFHWQDYNGNLITKGDNNVSPDNFASPLKQSDVVGVVWRHIDLFAASFWLSLRGVVTVISLFTLLLVWCLGTPRPDEVSAPVEGEPLVKNPV